MDIQITERPPATFALFGYNQERFIREAVEGAFSQTYSPLEIILTDDCSTDSTYSIMQEMSAAYKGPHTVHVNRSPSNRGLCPQLDAAVKLATGEWIIPAAGDDISLPGRVAEHLAITEKQKDVFSSFLAAEMFGEFSNRSLPHFTNKVVRYPESVELCGGSGLGAAHAFRKGSYRVFGDLGTGIVSEDWIISFRSSILGSVVWSDRLVVRYRGHAGSLTEEFFSKSKNRDAINKWIRLELNAFKTMKRDLQTARASGLVSPKNAEIGFRWLNITINTNEVMLKCSEADGFVQWAPSAIKLLLCRQFIGSYRRRFKVLLDTFCQLANPMHGL